MNRFRQQVFLLPVLFVLPATACGNKVKIKGFLLAFEGVLPVLSVLRLLEGCAAAACWLNWCNQRTVPLIVIASDQRTVPLIDLAFWGIW